MPIVSRRSAAALVAAALVLTLGVASPALAAPSGSAVTASSGPTPAAVQANGLERLQGPSRYETAVQVAQKFPAGQKAVFITTGADFPDALSAAAAAGTVDAPVLLTPRTWIQESVLAEVRRLAPERIYLLGGPLVVSSSVYEALGHVAPTERVYGTNRYETARKLMAKFHQQSDTVILATGKAYADALTASAAAGHRSIPSLLVDGTKTALDNDTMATIGTLKAKTVYLAGGYGAISIPIEQKLRTAGYEVIRYGGATRYDTAAKLTDAFLGDRQVSNAVIATGENFPDALTAAALSGATGDPLYLTRRACMPATPDASIDALGVTTRIVVGGQAVVQDASALGTASCGAAPTVPTTWKTSAYTFSTTVDAPYLDRSPVNVHDPGIVLDSTGLRVLNMGPGGSRVDHPVAFAQYGLSALLEYQRTGEQIWLDRALRHAERLTQIRTERDGAWYFPYLFDWTYIAGRTLYAPWWSAMAQGEALSLFVRLHDETGDASWRTAADHTWTSLTQARSSAEPWATVIEQDLLWFEEYAGKLPPLKVLNGHIFALFGVYDYWKLTQDPEVLRYLDGATTSALAVMPKIRVPNGVSYYCWSTGCQQKKWQNWRYHVIHSWQLDTLARLTGDKRFTDWSNLLRRDWRPPTTLRSLAPMQPNDVAIPDEYGVVDIADYGRLLPEDEGVIAPPQ